MFQIKLKCICDLWKYRPENRATSEEGIEHPFIDMGITKDDTRKIAKDMSPNIWNLPFSACLVSRIPYYETLEPAMLEIIGKGESYLHGLDFEKCRLCLHNNGELSRIEVPKERFEAPIWNKHNHPFVFSVAYNAKGIYPF